MTKEYKLNNEDEIDAFIKHIEELQMKNKQTKLRKLTIAELKNEKFIKFRVTNQHRADILKTYNLLKQNLPIDFGFAFISESIFNFTYTNSETNYNLAEYEEIELVDTKQYIGDKNVFYIDGLQCTTKDVERVLSKFLKPLKEEYKRSIEENNLNNKEEPARKVFYVDTSNISQEVKEKLVTNIITQMNDKQKLEGVKPQMSNTQSTEKVREQYYHLAKDYLFDVYYQQRDNIIETNSQNNTGSSLPKLPNPPTLEEIFECARLFSAKIQVS